MEITSWWRVFQKLRLMCGIENLPEVAVVASAGVAPSVTVVAAAVAVVAVGVAPSVATVVPSVPRISVGLRLRHDGGESESYDELQE